MATKLYDLVVVKGSYTTRDNKTKNIYQNVGSLYKNGKAHFFVAKHLTLTPLCYKI